jgi:hypothetical protein
LAFSSEGESTLFNFGKCDMPFILEQFVQKIKSNEIGKCLEKFPKMQVQMGNITKNFTCEI